MLWYGFVVAFVLGLLLVPGVRSVSKRLGRLSYPREDRWHRRPTPTLGGVAIYLAFLVGAVITGVLSDEGVEMHWGLLVGSSAMFILGLYDDLKRITPPAKLVGQILAATLVVFMGYTTNFFTPKIPNPILAQIPNILLTYIWLVVITNAINLLDNMDGLAGGIGLITAAFLGYFFWRGQDGGLFVIAIALAGSILGFLIYNFPPASIFMGDSGSLFIGFTLAVLAIARQPQASNVFAVLGVPTLLFLLPILDTTLVTITRLLRGQSPVQGGRDHTSHRLIAFGLSERQTLLVLYLVAVISGVAGIAIETVDYWLSLVLVPLLVLSLALAAAYLGRMKVVTSSLASQQGGAITRLMVDLTFKRRSLEIILDFFLIALAYYLAFWTYSGLSMTEQGFDFYLNSLPVAFAGAYLSFFYFKVYRGVWRYVGMDDLLRYLKAALGSVLLVGLGTYFLFPGTPLPAAIFVLYFVYLFLGLAASRSSFRILDQVFGRQQRPREERVLILGAGDAGEMALRWILMNPRFGYLPVGFLDDDPLNAGREIHGVSILGGLDQLESILLQKQIDGVVVTPDERWTKDLLDKVVRICRTHGQWVRSLRLEFEAIE